MLKMLLAIGISVFFVGGVFAGTWVKVRGVSIEDAFYRAQEKYGSQFVKRGSCSRSNDGYYYCDALIE